MEKKKKSVELFLEEYGPGSRKIFIEDNEMGNFRRGDLVEILGKRAIFVGVGDDVGVYEDIKREIPAKVLCFLEIRHQNGQSIFDLTKITDRYIEEMVLIKRPKKPDLSERGLKEALLKFYFFNET